jgi:nucleoid DNA-binding protein
MRKADIVRRMADATDLTQVQAEEGVNAIFDAIKSTLQQGDSVILRRFGTFDVRAKRARMGRNPKTGDEATIPARRVVRFKCGNPFKAVVNGSTAEPVAAPN